MTDDAQDILTIQRHIDQRRKEMAEHHCCNGEALQPTCFGLRALAHRSRQPHPLRQHMSHLIKRIHLFVLDYAHECSAAWSLARTNDCRRNGGHRWDEPSHDPTMRALGSTCSRCKCWQFVDAHAAEMTPTNGGSGF